MPRAQKTRWAVARAHRRHHHGPGRPHLHRPDPRLAAQEAHRPVADRFAGAVGAAQPTQRQVLPVARRARVRDPGDEARQRLLGPDEAEHDHAALLLRLRAGRAGDGEHDQQSEQEARNGANRAPAQMKYIPSRETRSRIGKRFAVIVRHLCASWCASKHRASRAGGFLVPLSLGAEVRVEQAGGLGL